MSKRDLYEVLGVSQSASAAEIKKAFRSKARDLHPDNAETGDESAFKELAQAYEVLSDEKKKSLYDRYGHEGLAGSASSFDGVDLGAFGDLSEIFSTFFGGGMSGGRGQYRRNQAQRGSDLRYDLEIDFQEAVFGCERSFQIKHLIECTVCSGNGAQPGSEPVSCATCSGQGQIRQTTQTLLGQFTQIITCPNCEGEGTRIEKACTNCRGKGQISKSREIEITIPKGIDNGSRLRVSGAGDHGRKGGPAGDLYVVIHVKPDPRFIREGTTIHFQQDIGFSLAALGGEIMVPTVDGDMKVKIPSGTQTGTTIVMRNKGVPLINNNKHRGDQILHLTVETPKKLSPQEKELFEKLAQLRGEKLSIEDIKSNHGESSTDNTNDSGNFGNSVIGKIVDAFKPKD